MIRGRYAALAEAMGTKNLGTSGEVPRLGPGCLAIKGESGHWEARLWLI
jgi:hypothetical protein